MSRSILTTALFVNIIYPRLTTHFLTCIGKFDIPMIGSLVNKKIGGLLMTVGMGVFIESAHL